MELKNLVTEYVTKTESGTSIDLVGLTNNCDFRRLAVEAVVEYIKTKPKACVVFQSYQSRKTAPLGKLINELAIALPQIALVTGDITNVEQMCAPVTKVILIKQSFRQGGCLKEQVVQLQKMGIEVSVFCLLTHSQSALQEFAVEHGIEATALLNTDEW